MPGLGELHQRCPFLEFFRVSTRKHPSMADDSYTDFRCFQRGTHTRGGGGTPIHYLYRYVPPNGVVILKLLERGIHFRGVC